MGLLAFRTAVKAPTIGSIASTSTSQLDIPWSLPAGFTIALTELEFSLDGATGWTQVYSGVALTFSHTGRSVSTAYYYRARVKDTQGNYSTYSAVSSQTTQANPTTVRFNPAHYFAIDGYNPTTTQVQNAINSAPSIIQGIQVGITWAQMESTQGNYSAGFTYVDSLLALCAARQSSTGQYFGLMLYINSDTAGVSPPYIQASGFDGGLGTYVPPAPSQRVPCFWRTSIQNALIARDIAYLDRYDSHPNFEMLAGPKGETDTTYDVTGGPGYTDSGYQNCFKNWATQCVPHAPHAQLRIIANFMPGGWSAMESLIQHCKATRIAMGGPDGYTRFVTVILPYPTDFTLVLHGYTKKSGSWAQDGTDYSTQGVLCIIHDMQTPEMGGKENGTASPDANGLYLQGVANGDHYIVWWRHQVCWVSPYNVKRQLYWDNTTANTTASDGSTEGNGHFTPDIKTFLSGNSVPLNSQRPSYYT